MWFGFEFGSDFGSDGGLRSHRHMSPTQPAKVGGNGPTAWDLGRLSVTRMTTMTSSSQQGLPKLPPAIQAETVLLARAPAPGGGGTGGTVPVGADVPSRGVPHITTHDWEPDQPEQLRVTEGPLVCVWNHAVRRQISPWE